VALNHVRIKKESGGVRLVTCVVDGRPVEPFYVYPYAYEKYGHDEKQLFQYLERQATAILDQFGDKYGRKRVA
jgi:hypothetical protein